jgi:hypothetical protein
LSFLSLDIVAYENFCLCDRSPSYVDRPNWQHGFSIVYRDPRSDYFLVESHPLAETVDGWKATLKAFFNGMLCTDWQKSGYFPDPRLHHCRWEGRFTGTIWKR